MTERREAVRFLVNGGLSVPRACAPIQIPRTTFLYAPKPEGDTELLTQIRKLAAHHPRYGYRRISVLLRRSTMVNEKRVRFRFGVSSAADARDCHDQHAWMRPIQVTSGPTTGSKTSRL